MEQIPIPDRIARFRRFYRMDNAEGPILGFFLAPYYPLKRYRAASSIPSGEYRAEDIRVARYLEDYDRLYREYRDLELDTIWTAAAFWGVPWVEAAAGCAVVADHDTGSSRTLAPRRAVEEPAAGPEVPAFAPGNSWARKLAEFVTATARHSAGRYPLGTTLMRGISDVLSALYGTPDFVYRLVDSPAAQVRVVDGITDLWLGLARAQLDRMPLFHGGVGSYFYNIWMPGRGVWIQEDAAALLSPELFERFVWPGIERIIGSFDTVIIHLHPSSYIPVDFLVDSGLAAIELHRDYAGATAEDLLPVYRRITERKPLIIWGDLTDADLDLIQKKLDRRSLALLPVVRDRERAEAIRKRFGR